MNPYDLSEVGLYRKGAARRASERIFRCSPNASAKVKKIVETQRNNATVAFMQELGSDNKELSSAMDLLKRASESVSDRPPDDNWFRDYFMLTGEHMILTDEGWQSGESKQELIDEYGLDVILEEINVAVPASEGGAE